MTEPVTGPDGLLLYANRTGRPSGRVLRVLGRVLPGVAKVRAQVAPYADTWHARNGEAITRPGRRWIVLGDSMAQAVGARTVDGGWVGHLAGLLGDDAPPNVVNLSATGARTLDVVEQQLPVMAGLPPAPGPDAGPDLVTVLIGSNDLFAGRDVRDALPDAFRRLVEALPDGSVVATLPQPATAAERANRHVEAAVRRGRLWMVDMRTAGPQSWSGRLAPDFFHPNDAGYAAIAEAFEPVVRQALAENG